MRATALKKLLKVNFEFAAGAVATSGLILTAGLSALLLAVTAQLPMPNWLERLAPLAAVLIMAVGAAQAFFYLRVSNRVAKINRIVSENIQTADLYLNLPPGGPGEIGKLIANLNHLTRLHRSALDAASKKADELAMLDLLVTTINRTLDLQEVLDTSLREALRAVDWDVGAIYLWDERTASLNMVSYESLSEDTVRQNITYKFGEGFIGEAAEKGEIVLTYAESDGSATTPAAPGWPDIQISVPLRAGKGEITGTLNMGSSQGKRLSRDELTLLMTVAAQVSLAIDKAQLYTRVSEHAVELESLVAARTEQLNHAIDELWIALKQAQEADRVKSLLLSTVSHELRTPLATIKGSASLLIEHNQRIGPNQRLDHLRDIEEEADNLTELISNLLDMSRIEAGALHVNLQPIDVTQVVRSSLEKAKLRHKDHKIVLGVPRRAISSLGDPRRIDQVVANFLDNAAKHSPQGTEINVTIRKRAPDVIVSVMDKGMGIAPEHQERIFDHFYQVNMSSDSGRHGIGLGLAICRGIIDAHHGKIWVESVVGKGTTLSFSIPLLDTSANARGRSP